MDILVVSSFCFCYFCCMRNWSSIFKLQFKIVHTFVHTHAHSSPAPWVLHRHMGINSQMSWVPRHIWGSHQPAGEWIKLSSYIADLGKQKLWIRWNWAIQRFCPLGNSDSKPGLIQGQGSHLWRGGSVALLGLRVPGGFTSAALGLRPGKFSSSFPLTLKLIKIESCKRAANLIFFGKECLVFSNIPFPGK